MKRIIILGIIAIISTFFLRCQKDEDYSNKEISEVSKIEKWFNQNENNYNALVLSYIDNLEWENAIVSNGDIGRVVEIPFTLKDNLRASNKTADLYNDHHRLMFVEDKDNQFKIYYIQIFTNDKNYDILDSNYNYYNIKDNFDGSIYVQELENDKGTQLNFRDGNLVKPSTTGKMREEAITCVEYGYWYEDGHFESLYTVGCFGGGGGSERDDPGPSYGGGGTNSGNTVASISQKIEKQINSDQLDPCSKQVLEKLKNLTQSDIANIISKFDSNVSMFTINIKTGKVTNPRNDAETIPSSNFVYNITLNENYTKGVLEGEIDSPPTTLSLATTLIHEILHAYLLSVVDEYKVLGSNTISNFPIIYDAYVTQKTPKGSSQAQIDAQHNLIANQFVNAIACTIQEFQTGVPVVSGYPNQVYQDIAWAGLEGTSIFNKNYPNDQNHKNYADRNRILSRGSIEKYNKPRGNQVQVGKPCK